MKISTLTQSLLPCSNRVPSQCSPNNNKISTECQTLACFVPLCFPFAQTGGFVERMHQINLCCRPLAHAASITHNPCTQQPPAPRIALPMSHTAKQNPKWCQISKSWLICTVVVANSSSSQLSTLSGTLALYLGVRYHVHPQYPGDSLRFELLRTAWSATKRKSITSPPEIASLQTSLDFLGTIDRSGNMSGISSWLHVNFTFIFSFTQIDANSNVSSLCKPTGKAVRPTPKIMQRMRPNHAQKHRQKRSVR